MVWKTLGVNWFLGPANDLHNNYIELFYEKRKLHWEFSEAVCRYVRDYRGAGSGRETA